MRLARMGLGLGPDVVRMREPSFSKSDLFFFDI
jgi:hypothetical protein